LSRNIPAYIWQNDTVLQPVSSVLITLYNQCRHVPPRLDTGRRGSREDVPAKKKSLKYPKMNNIITLRRKARLLYVYACLSRLPRVHLVRWLCTCSVMTRMDAVIRGRLSKLAFDVFYYLEYHLQYANTRHGYRLAESY